MFLLFDKRVNELWLKFGTGSYTGMLSRHIMHINIGHEMCLVILRLRVLIGCEVTCKIRTKFGALNAKPIDLVKKMIYVTMKQKKQSHTLLKFYVLHRLELQWMSLTLNRISIKVRPWLSCRQHHPRYLDISFDLILLFISTWIFWMRLRSPMFKIRLDWSWRWMFYIRKMPIINTSLLYRQVWMQEKMFPTFSVFVWR